MIRRQDAAWLTFWAAFALADYVADRRGYALCNTVRHLFRTDTPAGRLALTAGLGTGAGILLRHLVKNP